MARTHFVGTADNRLHNSAGLALLCSLRVTADQIAGGGVDVSQPVRAVIPTLDGPVLTTLAGSSVPLNLTDIARLADAGSLSGIRKTLLRLAEQGVVNQVPGGYALNREHLAAGAISQLVNLRAEFTRRLTTFVDALPEAPALVGLFGSYARRDGDSDSDIDILIVTDAPGADGSAGELAALVHRWTGNSCHIVVLTTADVARMEAADEPILAQWRNDLLVVAGDSQVLQAPG